MPESETIVILPNAKNEKATENWEKTREPKKMTKRSGDNVCMRERSERIQFETLLLSHVVKKKRSKWLQINPITQIE